jgi:2-polyprenyl-6-methoxyphenol hydroxylase-like FAD-dependent oxidoreductase
MKVAIFGAGLAGLACAISLHAEGHDYEIYERSRQAHDAGMGFILLPEAITGLASLGVLLQGNGSGVALAHYVCRNSSGEVLEQQSLPAGTRSFRRRDLIASMTASLNRNRPIVFHAELDRLEFDSEGGVRAAYLSSGRKVEAELYLAADGSRSKARTAIYPDWTGLSAPVAEVVGMVRCVDAIRWAQGNFNKFHAQSGGLAFGVLPVDRDHVVWFLQFDVQKFQLPPDTPEALLTFVENLVGDWAEPVPHLLHHTDYSRVHLWRPVDADLVPEFYLGNLVLVGDAAHPMLPFTSRGVSSAIADAIVLTEALSATANIHQALSQYSAQRRSECAPYISKGRDLTRNFLAPLCRETAVVPLAI